MTERVAVAGIDPSLRGMALVLGVEGLPDYELWKRSKPADGVRARIARYRALVDPIEEVLRQHKPRMALIETYPYGVSSKSVVDLGELGGILRDAVLRHCEHVLEVNVVHVKLFATGSTGGGAYPKGLTDEQREQMRAERRAESKHAVKTALEERYGITLRNDDVADAFALKQMGACLVGLAEPLTDFEARVVDGLRAKAAA